MDGGELQRTLAMLTNSTIERCVLDLVNRSVTLVLTATVEGRLRATTLRCVAVAHCYFLWMRPSPARGIPRTPPSREHVDPGDYVEFSDIGYGIARAQQLQFFPRGAVPVPSLGDSNIEIEIWSGMLLLRAGGVEIDWDGYALPLPD